MSEKNNYRPENSRENAKEKLKQENDLVTSNIWKILDKNSTEVVEGAKEKVLEPTGAELADLKKTMLDKKSVEAVNNKRISINLEKYERPENSFEAIEASLVGTSTAEYLTNIHQELRGRGLSSEYSHLLKYENTDLLS